MNKIEDLYTIFLEHPRISTDSRTILPDSVFFALKGPSFNGNEFADIALDKGAVLAVVDEEKYRKDDSYFLVEDGLQALQELAHIHRRKLKIPFLAITGSNGKTTTKELISRVLSKKFRTLSTKGNMNNHIGVPLTILSITPEIEFAVIEMGANHLQEIALYCEIAEPAYGLITNVGKAHLEGFGGFEGVKKGKSELYSWIAKSGGTIFINSDNDHLLEMAGDCKVKNQVRYGTKKEADCTAELIGDTTGLHIRWNQGKLNGEIRSKIIGKYNFENILAAICVGNFFTVNPFDISQAIASYEPDNSRSQVIHRGSNTVILDAYNANPTSMLAALMNFDAQPGIHKVVCLGEMAELGVASSAEHENIISQLSKNSHDQVILVGKNFEAFANQLNCQYFENSEKAAAWIKAHPFSGSTILIKGSRSTRMEKILESI